MIKRVFFTLLVSSLISLMLVSCVDDRGLIWIDLEDEKAKVQALIDLNEDQSEKQNENKNNNKNESTSESETVGNPYKEISGWESEEGVTDNESKFPESDDFKTDETAPEESGACEHLYFTIKVLDKATCTEPGEQIYVCTDCSESFMWEEIPPVGHVTDGEWIVEIKPTDNEPGLKYSYCYTCGGKITEEIPPLGDYE